MALTPEIEAKGLRAYEQAGAFERLRQWRLPLGYAIFPLVPVLCGIGLLKTGGHAGLATAHFIVAVFFAWGAWLHWRKLKARYAKNLQLLAEMERTYGDQLSWVQVENHFAALKRLERDLAAEKR
jgi:hypothetical protein